MTSLRHPSLLAGAALLTLASLPRVGAAQRAVDVRKNVVLVSRLGGKCLDVEGGSTANGARVIGYPCSGGTNQQFWFNQDGRINHRGKCVVVQGGQGRDGDQLVLWDCNGGANEQWRLTDGRLVGQNGKCVDLKGGSWGNMPFMNQPAILWGCHGGDNQMWRWALVVPGRNLNGVNVLASGAVGRIEPINGVVAAGGGNVVAAGGANVVAAGGGNVVAAGGAN